MFLEYLFINTVIWTASLHISRWQFSRWTAVSADNLLLIVSLAVFVMFPFDFSGMLLSVRKEHLDSTFQDGCFPSRTSIYILCQPKL